MGISKWIMTYSPGSVGALTRNWSKIYLKEREDFESEFAVHSTYTMFKISVNKTTSKDVFLNDQIIITNGKRCLSMFMFCLVCEFSNDMLKAILMDKNTYNDVIEIIHSQSKKIAPNLIKFSQLQLKNEAIKYVYEYYT